MLDLTGYKLTFSDEFNTRSISQTGVNTTWADIRSEWRYDANSDIGFGHSSFVDPASGYDPFTVAGGALSITAVPDSTRFGYPSSWESGLITTQGDFSQTYGYFEMRADLANQVGGWDAFWLLPNQAASNPSNLPGWQELDVVEHYGDYNQGTYRWIHTTDPEPNQNRNQDLQVFSNNPSQIDGYHTYGMNWQPDLISFYFDGQFMGSRPTPSDMHGPMYLLANLATQGSGSNNADIANQPITMRIDYVRAYSSDAHASAVILDPVSPPDQHDPGLYGASAAVTAALPETAGANPSQVAAPVATPSDVAALPETAGANPTQVATPVDVAVAVPPAPVTPTDITYAVYRFYDMRTGDHFYTTSMAEQLQIRATIPHYTPEGVAWATPDDGPDTQDVFRFYNSVTQDHFFTSSVAERDVVINTLRDYTYEGVAFQAYTDPASADAGVMTLERFYNASLGLHHFASQNEAIGIRQGAAGVGWVDEGPGFTVHTPSDGMLYI